MNRSISYESVFMELYTIHADEIFRYCLVRLRDREKALDVTQDIFYKLWDSFRKNPEKIASLDNKKAFLFTVARNTLIDSTRKKTSTPFSWLAHQFSEENFSTIEPITIVDRRQNIEEQHLLSMVYDYLDILDSHHREILILRFLNDFSVIDIADMYDISENAASVRIHRALEHARKKLSHLYE